MPHYVGLDVSQKTTAICVVDEQGRRLWRGVCVTDPGAISARVLKHAGVDVKVGVETGSMTPWLVHGLHSAGLHVECLDARRVKAALQMRLNKTGENDAEGLAQVMRTGWYRPVHVKSLDAHRARALLGARAQLVGMTTQLSAHFVSRVLRALGHTPRIIPAIYTKLFVKGQKNDYNDAEAIAEAALRPNLRVVQEKSQDQLDLQACHRVRSRLGSRRTATINQIRAFLIEQGIDVRAGPRALRNSLFAIL